MSETTLEKAPAESASLADFFSKHDEVNFNNCDKEPIHLIGSIQDHGALFILEPETQRIVSMSQNVRTLFGFESDEEFEEVTHFRDIFAELSEILEGAPVNRKTVTYIPLEYVNDIEGNTYNAIHHFHQGYDYLELWREDPLTASQLRNVLQVFHQQNAEILKASTFEDAIQCAFSAIRNLTQCDRVVLYEFKPDWSGHVIAEQKEEYMPSFLEIRFPDTDIPVQARQLMRMLPYRATLSVQDESSVLTENNLPTGEPIDLTWTMLRGVSKMHTEYLRNMDIAASFVVPLMLNERLWGSITLNFKESPTLSFDVMNFIHDFGISLMNRVDQDEWAFYMEKSNKITALERDIVAKAFREGDFREALLEYAPQLEELIGATGLVFIYGDNHIASGTVPPMEFIQRLVKWSADQEWSEGYFATEALHELWPEAKEHMDTACGVLVDHVRQNGKSSVVWFRVPVVQTITWAGNPDEKFGEKSPDEPDMLTPRNSFESWKAEHNDKSEYWNQAEIKGSREVVKNLFTVLSPPMSKSFDE